MATLKDKQFLDQTGLALLWQRISDGFTPRWLAYRPKGTGNSITAGTEATAVKIPFQSAGQANNGALGADITVTIPAATQDMAGVLTAADKKKIDNMAAEVQKGVVAQVKIEDKALTADASNHLNIGFDYDSTSHTIRLLDKNSAASDKTVASVDVNAFMGDLLTESFLASADVVNKKDGETDPTGLYIKMVFKTQEADGTVNTLDPIYIDVRDLVDVYSPGTGISITQGAYNSADNTARASTISLKTAAVAEIGGIRVHDVKTSQAPETLSTVAKRYFGVELGKDNKAIVNVPIGGLAKVDNALSGETTLSPATGGSIDLVTGINAVGQNTDKTSNTIQLGSTTIKLGKETSVTTPAATAGTAVTLKFGDTFNPLTGITAGGTNGHAVSSTYVPYTLPKPTLNVPASITYTAPSTATEIRADKDTSNIIVNEITGFTGTVSDEGVIAITPSVTSKKYWVNVESIPDATINALAYPAS